MDVDVVPVATTLQMMLDQWVAVVECPLLATSSKDR